MSQTQADIKRMIARDQEDLKEILDGYKFLPEYQDAADEVKKLREQLALAERKQTEIIVDYKAEVQDEIDFKKEDISYLKNLLNNKKSGLDINDYNQDLIDTFKKFHSIYSTSSNKRLQWVDELGNFAIFKTLSSDNVPVAWYLYHITDNVHDDIKSNGCYIWKTEGGHWSKKRHQSAMESMEGFLDREFFLNLLEELGWKKYKYRGCDYKIEFTAPDYDSNMRYFRDGEEGKEEYDINCKRKIYINYLNIPTTDAEAFAMYPVLKDYK